MAVNWPSSLPQSPQRSGYSYKDGDGRTKTDMEQGAPRFRRLYTNVSRIYNVQFAMSAAQVSTFENFYASDLAGGSISVNLPVRNANGNTTAAVYIVDRAAVQIDESNDFIVGLQVVTA